MPAQKSPEPASANSFGGGQAPPSDAPDFGADAGGDAPDFGTPDVGGEEENPFGKREKFDAGVDVDEESDPKKFLEQLAGKISTSLRDYNKKQGQPDTELEKFIVNSVVSATHTGQMDSEDQNDIIKKVKKAGKGDEGGNQDSNQDGEDMETPAAFGNDDDENIGGDTGTPPPDFGDEELDEEIMIEFDDSKGEDPRNTMYVEYDKPYSTEEPFILHTPNGKEKFEYCWAIYPDGRKDIGVYAYRGDVTYGYNWFRKAFLRQNENINNENILENLNLDKKFSTFVEKSIMEKLDKELVLRESISEVFGMLGKEIDTLSDGGEEVEIEKEVETPVETPSKPNRKASPYIIDPGVHENPDPKAEK